MELKNCPVCGKLHLKNALGMCSDCYQLEEKNELIIIAYVREHPNSSVEQIHRATKIPEKIILRMIRAGRFIHIAKIFYPCENCGKLIFAHRLCQECNEQIVKQAQAITTSQPIKKDLTKGTGMYTNFYKKKKGK